jgi:ADP-ribosylglycohydrolase
VTTGNGRLEAQRAGVQATTLAGPPGARSARARASLAGLSLGDAFGDQFYLPRAEAERCIASRTLPEPPWHWTDDTLMALSIVESLLRHGRIEQDELARSFAARFDIRRGYGAGMFLLLEDIERGVPWKVGARRLFDGMGSYGNGAAMRVAPLGAYVADDLSLVVEEAARSAEVTHAHPEGIAGAVAVAAAAAVAARCAAAGEMPHGPAFLDLVLPHVPDSVTRDGIARAREFRAETPVRRVAAYLGAGEMISAQDTVPFALWCAAQHLAAFEEALWLTVAGLGDRDTTCTMVGGILTAATGAAGLPPEWLRHREPLPAWPFEPSRVAEGGRVVADGE